MKLIFKILIAVFMVLLCAALAVSALFFIEGLMPRVTLAAGAMLIAFVGLVLGIILSKIKWLKIAFSAVVLVMLVAVAFAGIRINSLMSNLNEDIVKVAERPTGTGVTPAPMPILDYSDSEPDADSFDRELNGENDVEAPPVAIYAKEQKHDDVINILVLGQDADRLYTSGYGRSDVMMLLSYNKAKGSIKLLSFMRDAYVPIEGHNWNRLNTAIRFGGPGLIINTLNDLFDLDIQTYVTLAFDEFKTLVDNVGGIDIQMTRSEAGHISARWGGENQTTHLTGDQALRYVRDRSTGQGDFSRTEHQRKFMLALYKKLRGEMSVTTLLNLVEFAEEHIRTNLSFSDITTLAVELMSGPAIEIQTARAPFDDTWRYARINGASVLPFDIEANKEKVHQFLYGEE